MMEVVVDVVVAVVDGCMVLITMVVVVGVTVLYSLLTLYLPSS